METKLLLAVMISADKAGPIWLSTQQQKAAVKLTNGIKNNNSDTHCTQLLRSLLLSLYAPNDSSMHAADIFSSPVVAFLALLCKTEQGAYQEVSKIGHNVAIIQTCIRLRCLGHLMNDLEKTVVEGNQDDWIMYETPSAFICYANLQLEMSFLHFASPILQPMASTPLPQYMTGLVNSWGPKKKLQESTTWVFGGWGNVFSVAATP
jgi:hypothetical protein